jgi:hypothetical protein
LAFVIAPAQITLRYGITLFCSLAQPFCGLSVVALFVEFYSLLRPPLDFLLRLCKGWNQGEQGDKKNKNAFNDCIDISWLIALIGMHAYIE